MEFCLANSKEPGFAAGDSKPGAVARSLVEINLYNTSVQTLIDTGAKLSCISENLMMCDDRLKVLRIRKSDKRAYSVSGEPVVTLGIVEIEFKIGALVFTHNFTILRGLIHPILIGMDFLLKHRANIDLGESPKLVLTHPTGRKTATPFIKSMPKSKPATYVSLLREIEIPPHSTYIADAYIANVDSAEHNENNGVERLLGITAIQKMNDFFDPGFLLRDAVISSSAETFKVELLNPSHLPMKIEEDTPLGGIFDSDCIIDEEATSNLDERLKMAADNDEEKTRIFLQATLGLLSRTKVYRQDHYQPVNSSND